MIVVMSEPKINDIFKTANQIEVYVDGQKQVLTNKDENFSKLLTNILNCFEESYIAPAFGVSLHKDTLEAMQQGSWIKLNFSTEQTVGDLPFSSLLFKLDNCYGLNLIREHKGEFSGRCIYINFFNQTNLLNIMSI